MHSLPADYIPPPWEGLLLDAAIPGTPNGNSITLAATALEVFISFVLDKLAANQTKPEELWKWINNRSDHLKEPSVEDQYDKLLFILTGHSLKDEAGLWAAFKNLRSARNSFVHGGVVRIGKANIPLDAATVAALVTSAGLIIAKVREWVPPEIQWKQFDHKIGIEVSQKLSSSV